jgi:hypothetical protein
MDDRNRTHTAKDSPSLSPSQKKIVAWISDLGQEVAFVYYSTATLIMDMQKNNTYYVDSENTWLTKKIESLINKCY